MAYGQYGGYVPPNEYHPAYIGQSMHDQIAQQSPQATQQQTTADYVTRAEFEALVARIDSQNTKENYAMKEDTEMPNPLFNALGGNGQNPMLQQFQNFLNTMRGQDPNQIINNLVSSGRISQQQLNQVQQQARRMQGMFDQIKGNFNF